MEIINLQTNIERLIEYWKVQSISFGKNSESDFDYLKTTKNIQLPLDFKVFYSKVNGMESYYPNYTDSEGFLIYPLESIISEDKIFNGGELPKNTNMGSSIIFGDFMHKSWYYGINVNSDTNKYTIGIIPQKNTFSPICESLSEFIDLYLSNSSKLYNY